MVSKCANPSCSVPFRYLREGRIFHVAHRPGSSQNTGNKRASPHERFWLCDECSRHLTIISHAAGILVVPLPDPLETQDPHRHRTIAVAPKSESS